MKAKLIAMAAMAVAAVFSSEKADACSRVLYVGDSASVAAGAQPLRIVGRSLDWKTPIPTNLYVYPRGIAKVSDKGDNVISWTSKYGAVYAVSYDGGITEGMNEKGLAINGLFLQRHGLQQPGADRRAKHVAGRVRGLDARQLRHDSRGSRSVALDAVSDWRSHFRRRHRLGPALGHHDAEGRCAMVEFDHGTINIYEGQDIPVLTNDPTFREMNAINDYWVKVGGINMLPGTVKSPDRFVRGYFFQGHVERTNDADLGLSIIRSILFNVSVPYKYAVETEPNVSSTQWRSFSNLRDRLYYFDIVTNPGMFYIALDKCDLRAAPGPSPRHHQIVGLRRRRHLPPRTPRPLHPDVLMHNAQCTMHN